MWKNSITGLGYRYSRVFVDLFVGSTFLRPFLPTFCHVAALTGSAILTSLDQDWLLITLAADINFPHIRRQSTVFRTPLTLRLPKLHEESGLYLNILLNICEDSNSVKFVNGCHTADGQFAGQTSAGGVCLPRVSITAPNQGNACMAPRGLSSACHP